MCTYYLFHGCGELYSFAPFLLLADNDKDWPNWLGPSYNGTTFVEDLTIPQDGKEYPTVWTTEVGVGWSSPVIGEVLCICMIAVELRKN